VTESESGGSNRNTQSGPGNTRGSNAHGVTYQDNGAQDGVEISDGHKQALILFDDIPQAKPAKEAENNDNQDEDEDMEQSVKIEEFSEDELLGQYR
jgi:hypothetical protein